MKGIILRETIKQFGFKDGFSFWFRWSFINPIEKFIWLNITHKPYCLYSGFHCREENCKHKHLLTKKEILGEWKKHEKESKTIREGKDGMCNYCGEEKGQVLIDDPNWDTLERWKVCRVCAKAIEQQRGLSFGANLTRSESSGVRNLGLEIAKKSGKELDKISRESGKEFSNLSIDLNKLREVK